MKHLILIALSLYALLNLGCGKDRDTKTRAAGEQRTDSTAVLAEDGEASLCAKHHLPASICYLCDPSKRDPQRLWCLEHARYEDRCFLCHPELRDANRLYCDEHGLYEDECIFCHPQLIEKAAQAGTERSERLMCAEHGVPEEECGICHPERAEALRPGEGLKIRFPSTLSATKAGIEATPVQASDREGFVSAMGRLEFNQNTTAKVASPVEGQVVRVLVDLGQPVKKGETLLEINSRAWGEALAEEKAAKAALDREEELHRERVTATRDLEEARARYESARAVRLAAEGASLSRGAATPEGAREPRLSLRAPVSGTIVLRSTSVGDLAVPGNVLIEIADLDPLWALLSVPEVSARSLGKGDRVDLIAGSSPLASGHIEWIADVIDPSTRMVPVRVIVPNPDRALRAGTFVNARIKTGGRSEAVLVPANATVRFGGQPFVFLELAADMYEVRRVELGGETDGFVSVVAGLHPGDRVVSRQTYLVKSEFQKSRLGAGCVD